MAGNPLTAFRSQCLHRQCSAGLVDARFAVIRLQRAEIGLFLVQFIRIHIGQFNIGYHAFPLGGGAIYPVKFTLGNFYKLFIIFIF